MKVINMFGAPCSGKSTNSAGLAYELKKDGFKVELVTEFAKELCITKTEHLLENQIWVFGNQYHKMKYLSEDLDFIITDSPIMLSAWYGRKYNYQFESLYPLVKEVHDSFDNINIFLERAHDWDPYARVQSEEEALEDSKNLQKFLKDNNINFEIFKTGRYLPAILKKYILDINHDIVEKHHSMSSNTLMKSNLKNNKNISGVWLDEFSFIENIATLKHEFTEKDYIQEYNKIIERYNNKIYKFEYKNFKNEVLNLASRYTQINNQNPPHINKLPNWV